MNNEKDEWFWKQKWAWPKEEDVQEKEQLFDIKIRIKPSTIKLLVDINKKILKIIKEVKKNGITI